jgi:hypothetical protein
MRHIFLILSIFLLQTSCNKKKESFETTKNELIENLQKEDFDLALNLFITIENLKLNSTEIITVDSLKLDYLNRYKKVYLKNMSNKKDTIFNGFILNSNTVDFENRINTLRENGFTYSLTETFNIPDVRIKQAHRRKKISVFQETLSINSKKCTYGLNPIFDKSSRLLALEIYVENNCWVFPNGSGEGDVIYNKIQEEHFGKFRIPSTTYEYLKTSSLNKTNTKSHPLKLYFIQNFKSNSSFLWDFYANKDYIFTDNFIIIENYGKITYQTYNSFFEGFDNKLIELEEINRIKENERKKLEDLKV